MDGGLFLQAGKIFGDGHAGEGAQGFHLLELVSGCIAAQGFQHGRTSLFGRAVQQQGLRGIADGCPLGLGVVPYELPGSNKLADATLKELEDYDVVLWEKHGVFAKGLDVMDAFDQIDVLSKSCKIYINSKCMGFEPEGMSDAQLKEMTAAFNLPK